MKKQSEISYRDLKKEFQAKGLASTVALGRKLAWCIWKPKRGQGGQREVRRRETGKKGNEERQWDSNRIKIQIIQDLVKLWAELCELNFLTWLLCLLFWENMAFYPQKSNSRETCTWHGISGKHWLLLQEGNWRQRWGRDWIFTVKPIVPLRFFF